jgi:hypothetical protein
MAEDAESTVKVKLNAVKLASASNTAMPESPGIA